MPFPTFWINLATEGKKSVDWSTKVKTLGVVLDLAPELLSPLATPRRASENLRPRSKPFLKEVLCLTRTLKNSVGVCVV